MYAGSRIHTIGYSSPLGNHSPSCSRFEQIKLPFVQCPRRTKPQGSTKFCQQLEQKSRSPSAPTPAPPAPKKLKVLRSTVLKGFTLPPKTSP